MTLTETTATTRVTFTGLVPGLKATFTVRATVLGVLNIGAFFALLFIGAFRLPGGVAATAGAIQPLVAAGLADKCEIQLSYAIGVAEPTSVMVETFGTGKVDEETLTKLVREHFDLRPYGIVTMMDLVKPIYRDTATYGHFGREDLDLPWERTDKAEALRGAAAA